MAATSTAKTNKGPEAKAEAPKVKIASSAQTGQSIDLGKPAVVRHPDGTAMTAPRYFVPAAPGEYVVFVDDAEHKITVTDPTSKA